MLKIYGKQYPIYNFEEIDQSKYYGFIYVTVNKLDNKKYIGKHSRWAKRYVGSGKHLWRAIKKYGIENFEVYIIDLATSKEELKLKEEFYINTEFEAYKRKDWYNISKASDGGDTLAGYSEEERNQFRKNVSEGFKNMPENKRKEWLNNVKQNFRPLCGEKNGMYGSARFGELNPMFGKKQSEESKRKNSESNKGKQSGGKNAAARAVIILKNEEVVGDFETISEAAINFKFDVKAIRAMLRGYEYPENSKYYGWSARCKEEGQC